MYCHGKLYNRNLINKYNIRNSPEVRWYDDFYFNSMCTELLEVRLITVPLYLWCNNSNSVIRREDTERDKNITSDYLTAMEKSILFVLQHKDNVNYLPQTLKNLVQKVSLTEEQYKKVIELSKYIKE